MWGSSARQNHWLGMFLGLVLAAACLPIASAQTTEPWQSDWERFLDELAPYFQRGDGTFSIIQRFENKEVTWEGNFIGISGTASNFVDVRMNPRNMFCCGSGGFSSPRAFRVSMQDLDVTPWRALTPGAKVRFRTNWFLFTPTSTALTEFIIVAKGGGLIPSSPPAPAIQRVVNGASFGSEIASRGWITIQGTNLASTSRIWQAGDFTGNRLPTALDGVSVKVNNQEAPVYFISPTQINALAPADTTVGPVSVTVTTAAGTSAPVNATMQRYAPAFFMFDADNRRYLAAVHADGTFVGRPGLFGSALTSRPAKPGDSILLFGTGFGPTRPEVPANEVFSGAAPLADPSQLKMQIGNADATVAFAGLVGSGLYQFNVIVPEGAAAGSGESAVVAELGGARTQAAAFLTLQGTLSGSPQLSVTPATLRFQHVLNGPNPATQNLQVTSGGEPVNFTVARMAAWAIVDPNGRTPSTLRVGVLNVSFGPGTHTGSITLQPIGEGTPVVVPVTLEVIGRPPAITSVAPASGAPGQTIANVDFTGTDMRGVYLAEFAPNAGITVSNVRTTDTAATVQVAIQSNAALGPRQVTLVSLGGRSTPVTFSIAQPPPSPVAPVISNATASSTPSGPAGSGGTTNTFSFDFQDPDADITFAGTAQGSAKVRFELIFPSLRFNCFEEVTGTFLHKPGDRSGRISHTYTFGRGGSNPSVSSADGSATVPVSITLFDAGGRASNTIMALTPRWTLNCQ